MKKYIPIRGKDTCPICDSNSGKCRLVIDGNKEIILCMSLPDEKFGTIINNYKCIRSDSRVHTYSGSVWAIDNSTEWSEEQRRERQEQKIQRQQEQAREEQKRLQRSLAALKRHQGYTLLLQQLDRHPEDKKDLLQRGFTEEQIERIGFKSVRKYQKLSVNLDPQLPGVSKCGSYLLNAHDGYLCPVRNHEGLIIGLQYRLRELPEGDNNRYRWVSSGSGEDAAVLKLPHGENPIGFYMPSSGKPEGIALVDSLGPKAFLAAERLNKIVVGAAGGQFAASPRLFSLYLAEAQKIVGSKLVSSYPDGGDVGNKSVGIRWKTTTKLLTDWGYTSEFGWWGQFTKEDCDVDELPIERYSEIKYLSPNAYFKLSPQKIETTDKAKEKQESTANNHGFDSESNAKAPEDLKEGIAELRRKIRSATLTYKPNLVVNQRYLDIKDKLPKSGSIFIKSAKDTGKTFLLGKTAADAQYEGKAILNPTHRISLGRAIAKALGLTWVDEKDEESFLNRWLSLCIDSLHPYGKGKIKAEDWEGADLYIDEVEQALRHLFSSSTCRNKRSLIQKTLAEIVNTVLDSGGRVIFCDADLSNFSVSYFQELTGKRHKPFIVVNNFKHEAFPVTLYDTPSPASMMSKMLEILDKGGKILICSDSQKEDKEWGTYNIERDLRERYPTKKFIRIDAPNLDDKSSPAWGIFEAFDSTIKSYDGVILSPSCNTGLSIELFEHFEAVFGTFKGVLNGYDIHQFLWRLRDAKVRRHVWIKTKGIASNVIFWQEILKREIENAKESVARLLGLPVKNVESFIDAVNLIQHRYYAKFKARDNASKLALREHVIELLGEHGHQIELSEINTADAKLMELKQAQSSLLGQIQPGIPDEEFERIQVELKQLKEQVEAKEGYFKQLEADAVTHKETQKAVKDKSADELYQAIASAHDIESNDEALRLEKVRGLERKDKLALEKFNTKSKYKIDVTKELVKLDKKDRRLLLKLRTHYYLSHDSEFLRWRDLPHLESRLNPYRKMETPPDLDHPLTPQDLRLMSARVGLVEELGLLRLLEKASTEEGVKPNSDEITSIVANAFLNSDRIDRLLGVRAFEGTGNKPPMRIVQDLLRESMGLALTRATKKGKRVRGQKVERIYRFEKNEGDPRYAIFQAWEAEDEQALAELPEERRQEIIHEVVSWIEPDPLQNTSVIHQVNPPSHSGDPLGADSAQTPTSQAIQADPPQSPVKRDPPPAINIVLKDAGSHPDTSFIKAKGKQGEYKYSHNPNPAVEYSPTAVDGGADEEPTALEGLVNRLQAAANKDEALAAVAALPDRLEDALLFIGFGQRQRLRRWLSYKELSDRFGLIADSAEIDEEAFWRIANEFPSTDEGREVVEWAISLLGLDRGWRLQLLWEDGYSHKHGRSLVMA